MRQSPTDVEHMTHKAQGYLDGMYHRDLERLRRLFHPQASLSGYARGDFVPIPVDAWLNMVESRPIPAESGAPYDMEIVAMGVTGIAATVKVKG